MAVNESSGYPEGGWLSVVFEPVCTQGFTAVHRSEVKTIDRRQAHAYQR